MKSTIKLTGIKAEGKHGANPGEQEATQVFVLDIKVKLEVGSDQLEQTVDYDGLVNLAKHHVENNSYKLIETLAYNIASEICKADRVIKASVRVHKPSAAENLDIEDISAKVSARKDRNE